MKKLAGLLGLTALFAMPLCSCTVGDATEEGDNQTATDLKSVAQGIIGNVIGKAASKVTFADYEDAEIGTPYKFKNSEVTFYGVMMEIEDDFEDVCDDLKSYVKGYKKTSDGEGEEDGYMDIVYKKDGIGVALFAAEDYGICSVDVFDYKHYDAYCDVVYGEGGGGGSENEELLAIIAELEDTFDVEFEYDPLYGDYFAEYETTESLQNAVQSAAGKITCMEIDGEIEPYDDEESGLSGYEAYFYDDSGMIELNVYSCEYEGTKYVCLDVTDYSSLYSMFE